MSYGRWELYLVRPPTAVPHTSRGVLLILTWRLGEKESPCFPFPSRVSCTPRKRAAVTQSRVVQVVQLTTDTACCEASRRAGAPARDGLSTWAVQVCGQRRVSQPNRRAHVVEGGGASVDG